jgi:hypothetical protein
MSTFAQISRMLRSQWRINVNSVINCAHEVAAGGKVVEHKKLR